MHALHAQPFWALLPVRKYCPARRWRRNHLTILSNVVAYACRPSLRKDRHDIHQHRRLIRRSAIGGRRRESGVWRRRSESSETSLRTPVGVQKYSCRRTVPGRVGWTTRWFLALNANSAPARMAVGQRAVTVLSLVWKRTRHPGSAGAKAWWIGRSGTSLVWLRLYNRGDRGPRKGRLA